MPCDSMGIGKVSLNIWREWGIWSRDEHLGWNTLSVIRVKVCSPTTGSCASCYLSDLPASLMQPSCPCIADKNSYPPRQFCQISSHQYRAIRLSSPSLLHTLYCLVKHFGAPCSTSWTCNIEMAFSSQKAASGPGDFHMVRAQLPTILFSVHPFIP